MQNRFKRIFFIVFFSIIGLVLLVYLLLWLPPVQQHIKNIALTEVMKKTHNRLNIGKLKFRPFNQVQLEDVFASDLKGDTLLYVQRLSAGFDLMQLLNNRLLIRSVQLEDFSIRVNRDSLNAPFNFQFFIDAFSSEDTTKKEEPGGLVIEIDRIALNRGNIQYDIFSEPVLADTLFDPNHIHVRELETEISLKSIDIQKLNVDIGKLAFKEQSGFELKDLQVKLASENKRIQVEKALVRLPQSELVIRDSWVDYTGMELDQLTEGASYSFSLDITPLHPSDLRAFYPPLALLEDSLHLGGEVVGTFPEINLSHLQVNYGKHIILDADARIKDFNNWKHSPLALNLNHFFVDAYGMEQVWLLSGKEPQENKMPVQADALTLTGIVSGSLPALRLNVNADSKTGKLDLKGEGGYLVDTGESHFDIQLAATDFDLRTLLQNDSLYGQASLSLNAQGKINASGSVNAKGNVAVERFDFNRYRYHDIHAKIAYAADSLSFNLISEDPNLSLGIDGTVGLGKKNPSLLIQARIPHLRLDTLNLLPAFPGADLSTTFRADIRGFDPESMQALIQLDSLSFATQKGTFREKSIRIDFQSSPGFEKKISVDSELLRAKVDGNFAFGTLMESFSQTLSAYFPTVFPVEKKKKPVWDDRFQFDLVLQNTRDLSSALELPFVLPDSALLHGRYEGSGHNLELQARIPRFYLGEVPLSGTFLDLKTDTIQRRVSLLAGTDQWYETVGDTTQLRLKLENINENLSFLLDFNNHTSQLDLKGSVDAAVRFTPAKKQGIPDMEIHINPTSVHVNGDDFHIQPSRFTVEDNRYTVENFTLTHTDSEYLKLNGVVSGLPEDTLSVELAHLQLKTIAESINLGIKLGGEANGKIVLKQLLTTPLILTEGFTVRDITLENKKIGTLNLVSGWSSEHSAVFFNAELSNPGVPGSVLKGFVSPKRDSLYLDADIKGIMMDWLEPFTTGTLYGLEGELGAKIQARGSLKVPQFEGAFFLKDATIGVTMLNTLYRISDSIYVRPKVIDFKDFVIRDEKQQTAVIRGTVSHKQLTHLDPHLTMDLNDFLVINNANQTDSLFYGNLRIKGHLDVLKKDEDIVLNATLSHSRDSKIMINIPESATEAHQYSSITFVNSEGEALDSLVQLSKPQQASFSLPLKMNISLSVTPDLMLGAVINPETKDAVQVSGTGLIDFSYDLNNSAMNLLGDYTIKDGKCTLSLKNITRKTFTVQEGGKLIFKGDPMKTAFDVTAVYSLRADLASLDPTFTEIMTTSTKVPVNCLLTVTGDLNKMELKYRVYLPGERDEIQRKVDGLLYTDDIRIKEIAYLLAFGTFMPLNSDGSKDSGPNIWTSLASSSITSQLNNLLSGVLNENWSIGTELHSGDGGFSDMEMDVNVSTRLFDDRLTLNSNIGYRNAANTGSQNNFTGDFDLQYKLNRSGNVILKVYNVTNNQYYETARTTQGVGLIYKKESRTFKGLFRKIKSLFR